MNRLVIAGCLFALSSSVFSQKVKLTELSPSGMFADWDYSGTDRIVYDVQEPDEFYDIYISGSKGENKNCITCNHPILPNKNTGSPDWHPSGKWIVFIAEKSVHPGNSDGSLPGYGGFCDLWVMSDDGTKAVQLTDNKDTANNALLIPKFSPDGKKVTWVERTGPNNLLYPPHQFGTWAIKIADFTETPSGPALANIKTFKPGGDLFYECYGFTPDGSKLIICSNIGQSSPWQNQIFTMDTLGNNLVKLTRDSTYNEHAFYSPDGNKIVWMTNDQSTLGGTDWWIMNTDGSQKERLTFFNEKGNMQSTGSAQWALLGTFSPDGKKFVGGVQKDLITQKGRIVIAEFILPEIQQKYVRRQGTEILDSTGKAIKLNGVNLGGWLLWEGWIWGGGLVGETPLIKSLASVTGDSAAQDFRNKVRENYITEDDIAAIAQSCHNVVRVAFNHNLLEDDAQPYLYKQSGWKILDSVLAWCEKYHVYAVLDLHAAPGGQNTAFISDPDPDSSLWSGKINQDRTIKLWGAIAGRYKNKTIVAGYDLLNEPVTPWFEEWKLVDIYQRIIKEIRSVDSYHMMILEGNNYAKDFWMFSSLPDSNMAFSFHVYTWFGEDPITTVAGFNTLPGQYNVPVWCGEWGENNYQIIDSTRRALDDTANHFSGWCFWTWKKVSNNQTAFNAIQTTAVWTKLIQWMSDSVWNPKPTYTETMQGISDFLTAIQYKNTTQDQTLKTLLDNCTLTTSEARERNEPGSITVFPNPATDYLDIVMNGSNGPETTYTISDICGKTVSEGKFSGTISRLNTSYLPQGIFFLRLFNHSELINIKFEVVK